MGVVEGTLYAQTIQRNTTRKKEKKLEISLKGLQCYSRIKPYFLGESNGQQLNIKGCYVMSDNDDIKIS